MKKKAKKEITQAENRIKRSTLITVICDVVLIIALVICLLSYISVNNDTNFKQNIKNITNIANAKSELLLSSLSGSSRDVETAYRYCEGKSVSEIMDYLNLIDDEDNEYQLLKYDEETSTDTYYVYTGYSTKKKDETITYKGSGLAMSIHQYSSQDPGVIRYSQGFTNKVDAQRYFAAFCGIEIIEDGKTQMYYLVKPQKETTVLDMVQTYTQYGRLDTAICYADGEYLAKDDSFRAVNFFDYIYQYNSLSLDEKNAMKTAVNSDTDGAGYLEYENLKGQDCIFSYASCGDDKNWFIIVAVPVSEFVTSQLLSFFPLIIIGFLVVLLIFNTWRLLIIVKQLRQSVEREKIANTSKSSFLSRMSHEIRTPLNAVIGYNIIARSEMTDAKDEATRKQAEMKVMDCLVKSDIASKHLLTIINDVLDMSAIESGKINVAKDRFDFKGMITSLTTVFYSQARAKGVDFEVVFDTLTEEWFVGDQIRTNQILTNLLSNAIKFTLEGGAVKLKIQQPDVDTNSAHIHFEISDTGIGMSPEYLERIWSPFEQADSSISRRFGGTGLGLSITKNLVSIMDGTISVESKLGVGTTFFVDLTFEKTKQPQSSNLYDFSRINALVVDDDSSTCDYIRLLFNRCGAKCATVTSGADAVKAVSVAIENKDSYTVCLVDWRMPGMDGIETIKRIRELVGEELPIIVLTAYDYAELADKAAEVGVNSFISKPLFQSSLFDMLANICGTKKPVISKSDRKADFDGGRILLAEDNNMNMEIAKRILETGSIVVDSAWNGKEAVEMFEASEPGTYMAILMDVHMPEMDGHEATRTIRASSHPEAKTIPIIAMTADAFAENVAEAHASGMDSHIAKPIDITTLFDTLKKYIKR